MHHSRAPIDAGSRGYELLLEHGRVAFGLHHMWPGNSLKVVTKRAIEVNDRTHVLVTYDGSSKAAGVRIYLNGEPAELEVVRDGLWKDILYEGGEPDTAIGFRFRDNGFRGGLVDDFRVYNRALTHLEAAHLGGKRWLADAWALPPDRLAPDDRDGLFEYFLANIDETAKKLDHELNLARREQSAFVTAIPEMMVMKETDRPKPAFVLNRGAYDAPGEPVTAEHAARDAADAGGRAAQPAGPRAVAAGAGEPADGARDGEPLLAADVRPGDRRDGRQLRQPGRAADAPGTARPPRPRVRRRHAVGRQTAAEDDRDVGDVPAILPRRRPSCSPATRPTCSSPAARPGASLRRCSATRRWPTAGCSSKSSAGRACARTSRRGCGTWRWASRSTTRGTARTCTAGACTRSGSGRSRRRRWSRSTPPTGATAPRGGRARARRCRHWRC